VAFFTKSRAFRIDKARRVLGYEPRVPLDEGLRETMDWYRAEGLL
jgi:sterol-4alpha-carboxylate 3-dehydrogenase (decarboxylating)